MRPGNFAGVLLIHYYVQEEFVQVIFLSSCGRYDFGERDGGVGRGGVNKRHYIIVAYAFSLPVKAEKSLNVLRWCSKF